MKKKTRICIFLVFIVSIFLSTAPFAQAATVDATGLKQLFDQQGSLSRWSSLKNTVDSPTLPWSETYIMRSYLIMYQATGDKKYIAYFIDHADSVLARRDNVRGVKDYRGYSLPVWRNGKYTDYKTYYIYADETGLIATPLAQFAALVKKDPKLASYKAKANEYATAAKDAINVLFMSELRNSDVNFRWIEDSNSLYLDRPINKNLAVGSALLAIYEATGDKAYLDKGIKVANFFKQRLLTNQSTLGYYWKYYPDDARYINTIEDTNHANVVIQFVNLAYNNGIFSDADMQKFANTATKVLVKKDGTIANRLDGSGTIVQQGQIGNWSIFASWAPSLFDAAYKIITNKSSLNPPEIQGLAYLNYVLAGGDSTNQPPDTDPEPAPTPNPKDNLIINGDFSSGSVGWVNQGDKAKINTETNGNQYLSNTYNFTFYQDMQLEPGTYEINAKTRKGTAEEGARIVIRFFHRDGSDNFKTFTYKNKGTGWETMPEMTLEVPATAVTTRIYLSGIPGDSGNQHFDNITMAPAGDISVPVPDPDPPAPTPDPDTEAPVVTINTPASGSTLQEKATLKAAAGDNIGVTQLTLAYATNAQGSWTTIGETNQSGGSATEGTWQLAWDISGLANGIYYLRATAKDAAGNITSSDPVAIKIKNIASLITNGDFSSGSAGWVNQGDTAKINAETNGNQYLSNTYNFTFYQDMQLESGTYEINAKTRKGTAEEGARIVIRFFHRDGSDNFKTFTYKNKGTGWETMPEMTLEVPATAVTTRIYLSGIPGDSGNQHFDDITMAPAGDISVPVPDPDPPAPTPDPDTEAPVVTINTPASGSTLQEKATLKAAAGDNVGVTQLTLAYATDAQGSWTTIGEAGQSGGSATEGTWQLAWDISSLANGTYYLRATAKDAAGNITSSDPVAVKIKNIANLITNGDFSSGSAGWVNQGDTAKINAETNAETNGNQYLTNTYNFTFYQDMQLEPGTYEINAKTRKGTAEEGARIVIRFFHRDGSDNFKTFTYKNKGTGWEAMPEMTLEVPATAVTTRIYLSGIPGDSGNQHFDDIIINQ